MTIFSPQKFHQKAKNPRKLPIYPKFDVPKVPEVYGGIAKGAPAGEKRGPKMIFYDLFFFDFSILKKVSFTIDIRVIKI